MISMLGCFLALLLCIYLLVSEDKTFHHNTVLTVMFILSMTLLFKMGNEISKKPSAYGFSQNQPVSLSGEAQ